MMSGKSMKRFICCSKKFKLLLLVFISFLWSFLVFYVLNSSLVLSTLWLSRYVQLYHHAAVVFLLVAIIKARGKFNKVNELRTYVKAILYAFVITVIVAHAVFCGWVVYMVLEQSVLLAAVAGSIQIMFNVALLFVKDLTHSSA